MTRRTLLKTVGGLPMAVPALSAGLSARGTEPVAPSGAEKQQALLAAERAFAKTMADRDHAAFAAFIAEEGVFFTGTRILTGRAAVVSGWKPLFDGPDPPFSWEPDRGEVLASGTLGMTSGPVRDPSGARVGTFNSTWRLEPDGKWRVVFDIGCPPCECK